MTEMRVVSLHRYPVKGLSPEPVQRVQLTRDAFFPGDRLYAIENGASRFDAAAPAFLPKIKFLMLMKQGRLAALHTRYDDATRVLTISRDGRECVRGDLGSEDGRAAVEAFIADYCKGELRGPPRVLAAPAGFRFTDSLQSGFVSFLNRASLEDLEKTLGQPVDPLRFRANVLVDGLSAWEENDWTGATLSAGALRLKIDKRIERCNATNVRPGTGERDLDLIRAMMKAYGHFDCGFYASVTSSGPLGTGDMLTLVH